MSIFSAHEYRAEILENFHHIFIYVYIYGREGERELKYLRIPISAFSYRR